MSVERETNLSYRMKTLENPGDAVSKTKSSFTFRLLCYNAEHRHLSFPRSARSVVGRANFGSRDSSSAEMQKSVPKSNDLRGRGDVKSRAHPPIRRIQT
jgi:hypothetical protein